MDLVEIISYLILLIVSLLLIKVLYVNILLNKFSVAIPVSGVLIIFYILPLIYDFTDGIPDYSRYPGLGYAYKFPEISSLYNFYIAFVGFLFYKYLKRRSYIIDPKAQEKLYGQIYKIRYVFWLFLFLPILGVIFTDNPAFYLDYKAVLGVDESFKEDHIWLSKLCFVAILGASMLFFLIKRGNATGLFLRYLLYFVLTFIAIWIFGKRSIVANYIVLILTNGWVLGIFKGRKLIRATFVLFTLLVLFIVSYGKGIYEGDESRTYTATRINFGRDQVVKFSLYKEFIDEKPILDYRGQSFLFDLLFFVPREIWSAKPYPYAVYFTTSVFSIPPEPMGWGFTTSILDEGVSNFGFLGLFITPIFMLWLIKIGDRTTSLITKTLSVLTTSLFLVLHLPAFIVIFIFYIFLLYFSKRRVGRNLKLMKNGL